MVDAEQRGQAVEAVAGDQLGESPTSSEMAEQLRELQEHWQAPEVARGGAVVSGDTIAHTAAKEQHAQAAGLWAVRGGGNRRLRGGAVCGML